MIFMFDAGRKSFPAFIEYNVSRVVASMIRIPQCAFAYSGALTALSMERRSSSMSFVPRARDGSGDTGGGVAVAVPDDTVDVVDAVAHAAKKNVMTGRT
jgi:hypothetical protein